MNDIVNVSNYVNDSRSILLQDDPEIQLHKHYDVNDIVNFPNYVNDPGPMLPRDGPRSNYISIIMMSMILSTSPIMSMILDQCCSEIQLHKHYVNGIVNFPNYVNDLISILSQDGLEIQLYKHYLNDIAYFY